MLLKMRLSLLASLGLLSGCASLVLSAFDHLDPGQPVLGRSGRVSVTPMQDCWIRDDSQETATGDDLALLRDTADALLSISIYSSANYDGSSQSDFRVFEPDAHREESPDVEAFAARVGAARSSGACGRVKLSFSRACDFVIEVQRGDTIVLFEGFTSALTQSTRAARIAELGELVASAAFRLGPTSSAVISLNSRVAEAVERELAPDGRGPQVK